MDASPAGEDGTSGQEKGATTGKARELSKAASMGDASEMLTETTIFARLVAELGRQPERCLALTDIRKRLTEMNLPTLRQRAEDTGYLRKWLQKFPGLLELTGPPGAEQLRLTLGRAPQAQPPASGTSGGGGAADAAPSARAPPGGSEPRAQEGGGGDVKCSLSMVAAVVLPLACESADEALSPCTVQLRGLPFTATIADIRGLATTLQTSSPRSLPSAVCSNAMGNPQASHACSSPARRRQKSAGSSCTASSWGTATWRCLPATTARPRHAREKRGHGIRGSSRSAVTTCGCREKTSCC